MIESARLPPPIGQLCEKYGARQARRLRGECLPAGDTPFPGTPEEAEWMARRESLVVTVLGTPEAGIVLGSWTRGGATMSQERRIPRAELDAWLAELDARGAWTLQALAAFDVGEAIVSFEHEAYEYHDENPDSLDLDSWRPPRHARIHRGRNGCDPAASRRLVAGWARFLPDVAGGESPLARLIRN